MGSKPTLEGVSIVFNESILLASPGESESDILLSVYIRSHLHQASASML